MSEGAEDTSQIGDPYDIMVPFDLETFAAASIEIIGAVGDLSKLAVHAVVTFGDEYLKFLTLRLNADVQMPQHLYGCVCPEGAYDIFVSFLKQATDQYISEAERFGELWRSTAERSVGIVEEHVGAVGRRGSSLEVTETK